MGKAIYKAFLILGIASSAFAQLPYQSGGHIQDVRIMGVGPGGVGSTFGIIISSTVPFLDHSNTFTTTQTINAQDLNGFSLRLSSGIILGGCVQYGDGTLQCTATVTDPGVSIELSQLNASTQTLSAVKGSTGVCPSGYLVQDIWASSITCAAVLSTVYTAQPIIGDGSVGNPIALNSAWQNGLAVSTTGAVQKTGDTMTGPLTITSTLTVQGQSNLGNIVLVAGSTIATSGTLTISTASTIAGASQNIFIDSQGRTSFTPNISTWAATGVLTGTFNGHGGLGPCVAGSTVSITLPAPGSIHAIFHGSVTTADLDVQVELTLLSDGNFVDSTSSTLGLVSIYNYLDPGTGDSLFSYTQNASFDVLITGLTAGSHRACLSIANTAPLGSASLAGKAILKIYALP